MFKKQRVPSFSIFLLHEVMSHAFWDLKCCCLTNDIFACCSLLPAESCPPTDGSSLLGFNSISHNLALHFLVGPPRNFTLQTNVITEVLTRSFPRHLLRVWTRQRLAHWTLNCVSSLPNLSKFCQSFTLSPPQPEYLYQPQPRAIWF